MRPKVLFRDNVRLQACTNTHTHTQRFILRFRLPRSAVFCFVLPVFYDWRRFSSMSEFFLFNSQETPYMVSIFRVEIAAIVGSHPWGRAFLRKASGQIFFFFFLKRRCVRVLVWSCKIFLHFIFCHTWGKMEVSWCASIASHYSMKIQHFFRHKQQTVYDITL